MKPDEAAKAAETQGSQASGSEASGRQARRGAVAEAFRQAGFYLGAALNALICLRLHSVFDSETYMLVAPPSQIAALCGLGLAAAGFSAWLICGARVGAAFKRGAVAFGAVAPALLLGFFLWAHLDRP